jgi:predicted AAA+ superfamily ATPase
MYRRILAKELVFSAAQFRTVTLIGPRQAGKSTLCRTVFPTYRYVSLEDPDVRDYARTDPRAFLKQYDRQVIFDEIQRVPELLSYIQGIVDRDHEMGQFILTGSHQLELNAAISQSLAGRTARLTLLPLSLEELPRQGRSAAQCVWEGGMPGRHADAVDVSRFYRSYFQTYVERDVRLLLQVKEMAQFEKFVRLCAGRVGQVLNVSSLAGDVGVTSHTVEHWISVLEASFIVFRLQPYFENFGKRLIKSAKLYFTDTGLAAWLLGIETPQQLERDPLWGSLFENMVVLEAMKARLHRGLDANLYYFRDSRGNEVDLLFASDRRLRAIEVKAAQTFHRSFLKNLQEFSAVAREKVAASIVVYGGDEARQCEAYDLVSFADTWRLVVPAEAPIEPVGASS